jgi:hypothetical protein
MNITNGTHFHPNRLETNDSRDGEQLRAENEELRSLVIELEQALHHHGHGGGEDFEARQREYEALLEEKSELIRGLHRKVQAMEKELAERQAAPAPAPKEERKPSGPAPREEELMALSEELERERKQLKEDEDALMDQMREMEVQMARERAELARQRNELQRLQAEIRHELELAARDATLRERLAPLQRRHHDITARKGAAPAQQQQQQAQQQPQQEQEKKKGSGLFRRLFG